MGLFKFVKKGILAVARFGLNKVTQGLSEKVITSLKAANQLKAAAKLAAGKLATEQQAARLVKLGGLTGTPATMYNNAQQRGGIATDYSNTKTTTPNPMKPANAPIDRAPRRRRKVAKKTTRRIAGVAKGTGHKRTAPKGGLDLAKIGSLWRASSKSGTYRDFVKAHSHIRK